MSDSSNQQYSNPPFGLAGDYASTNAPGSAGISASQTAGAEVGRPVVSVPGFSSQLPEGRPTIAVMAGDSSGMADDLPAHTSQIMPGPQDSLLSTGAGDGATIARHPNAGR